MNITISQRSKSHNSIGITRSHKRQVDNQEHALDGQQISQRKNNSLNKKTNEEEQTPCGKWLFQRCLKKPSNFDQEFVNGEQLSLKKEPEFLRNTGRPGIHRHKKLAEPKQISIVKNTLQPRHRHQCKIKVFCNREVFEQLQQPLKLSKQVYLQKDTNISKGQESGQYLKPFQSQSFGYQYTNEKNKYKSMEFSLKPSTVVSSSHSCHQAKDSPTKKLKLSNNFQSLIDTTHKPFSFHSENKISCQENPIEEVSNQKIKPPSQQAFQRQISRLQLVYPSQYEFKIQDPQKSSQSINTSYIKKRIQFSSGLSDKAKLQNYVYEPVYVLNSWDRDSESKNLNNYNSEVIRNIKVDNEDFLNSAKYSQQSLVLQKGLDEIFDLSPTFQAIDSQSQNRDADQKQIIIEDIDNYEIYSKEMLRKYHRKDEIMEFRE